jgi:uncharacterized protein (TIGR00159 family)
MNSISLIKHIFEWRALVDIFLISAGLFFLYRTLLRLGTWGVAAGILIAMLISFMSSLLDLKGIEWIFSNLSHVALIALIIIFQPELRKIFERAAFIYRSKRVVAQDGLLELLVNSLWRLADKRQGALIVLPGKEPIKGLLSGGYTVDAKPSVPLIMSIFDPHSPGHDGAVILDEGRLTQFGVRLPVSQSERLSEEYGTRHHAGMGLAEQSDAMIIVVSEERGQITVFNKGTISKINDHTHLANTISEHWRNTATHAIDLPQKKLNWQTMAGLAASFALAIFFWSTLIVLQSEILEKIVTVPVEFTEPQSHLSLVGNKEKNIQLHLSGSKSDLNAIDPAVLSVKLDLAKAVEGKQTYTITADNIRLPRNITLLDVTPSSVELTLAEIVEKEVIIEPQLIGTVPGGNKILSLQVVPSKVRVLSPATVEKDQLVSVQTTPIYLSAIRDDAIIYCKVIAPPAIQPVEKRWPDVEVTIKIAP